ncbi:DNA repair protein RadC [Pseudodesulfovibrio sp. F-1]|uniref:DNA repair protein RadC n=1 Tax=Pseudodesulfovibrio alkaliphilus TaxID=2661613 RepID=A0A7K1KKI1_9BACT|nr:DNA repair protein RadC [Pseudodesulfovibrio alkaliphilus]MUM76594.1 DNA repair protein RadC [Pseudodesulfovibrio alkaliphilus]
MKEKDKPHYLGHRQRLREKLLQNGRSLADYELLELTLAAVLPRRDTKPLAKLMITRFGSLKDALTARPEQLEAVSGIGPAAVAHWALLQELFARMGEARARSGVPLSEPADVARAAMARIGSKGVEEFWAAFLDIRNRVIAWEQVSKGTVDATPVFPREIMATALRLEAAALILAHNHPGGDPTPSMEDLALTQRIRETARGLDIRVLDHIIVTDHDYYSFNEHGRM